MEHDLIICRALVELYNHPLLAEQLAFRGGTALFKLHLPPARYSEDIDLVRDTREQLHLSRAVFAHELHISPRTLEKWEQGLTKPNEQAATLILLVRKYPDTLQRLKQLAA